MIGGILFTVFLIWLTLKFGNFVDNAMSEHVVRRAEYEAKYKGK